MNLKELWNEAYESIDSAIADDNIESIKISTIKLIQKLQKIGINNLYLTSLGNDIALGYSKEGIIKSVFDRNDSLDKAAHHYNFNIKKYIVANDSKYNNIYNWLLENISLGEINIINSSRLNIEDKNIKDIIENNDKNTANIIIYNGCSLRNKNTMELLKKDLDILDNFLNYVENNNKKNNSNTQVYISGIPNVKIFNGVIKKIVDKHANANYIKPVDCDILNNGRLNFKYNERQYRRYNMSIIKNIDDNYLFTQALIDIDRSNGNDEVINNWLNVLKKNHCNLNEFKKRLSNYQNKVLVLK